MSKYETMQSLVSYGTGTGGIAVAHLIEPAHQSLLQDGTLIGGFALVVLRLAYDGLKLYRYIRKKYDEQGD